MDCHRELGCSEEDVQVRLSRYLDGELPPEQAGKLEEHLKRCERCRGELAEIKGADRQVAHAVSRTSASDGFAGRVMTALRGAAVGKPVPKLLAWVLVAVAALGAGALAMYLASTIVQPPPMPPRELGWRLADSNRGVWNVSVAGRRLAVRPGEALAAGGVVDLAAAPGELAGESIVRSDGTRVFADAGTSLSFSEDATDERGLALAKGRVLAVTAGGGLVELALPGGAMARLAEAGASVLFEARDRGAVATVLSGRAVLVLNAGTAALARSERAALAGDANLARTVADLRALDLGFVPPEHRTSPWPQVAGEHGRGGRSPFAFSGDISRILDVSRVSGASGTVVGRDGTAYFLAGPAPGRLIGVRGGKLAADVPLPGACVGDPAFDPAGRLLVATAEGTVMACDPAADRKEWSVVATGGAGRIPRAGPAVGPDGEVFVAFARGIAAFGPDGAARWRRDDVTAGAPLSVGPDGTVYATTLGGRLYALDRETGGDLAAGLAAVDDAFLTHAAVAPDGTSYAVSAKRYLVWRAPDGATGRAVLPEADYSLPPAVAADGTVFIASSSGAVLRLPARPTGPPGASFYAVGEPVVGGPLVDGKGCVIVWTRDGDVVSVDATGRPRSWELGARDPSPGAIDRSGALTFATRDGQVFGK